MNEREVAELRRRFSVEKSNISRIRGCHVNESREITSQFNQSLALMSEGEAEEILSVLKKTLSGSIGKNLIDVDFSTSQVLDSDEHKTLMRLRDTSLDDDEAVEKLYKRIIESLATEGSYLILLASDKYDVFSYSKDGGKSEDSSVLFSYILCSICPMKLTKPVLGYSSFDNSFKNISANSVVSPPELGFMFPAFDDRRSNIYNALFYTKNIAEDYSAFTDAVFKSSLPLPAQRQKETFGSIISEVLSDDCDYNTVQSVRAQLCEMIESNKANKYEEPVLLSKRRALDILRYCVEDEEQLSGFEEKYDENFGKGTEICPQNAMDVKKLTVSTENVEIKLDPEYGDLLETRVIDGIKYILIRAEGSVEVNGIEINIK